MIVGDRAFCFTNAGQSTWVSGVRLCGLYDSELFLPLNAQEMADFYNYMKSINIDRAWINGNKDNYQSEWRDSNHNPINYFNWGPGKPRLVYTNENYITVYAGWNGRWNNDNDRHSDYIICHKPLSGKLFLSSHNFSKTN